MESDFVRPTKKQFLAGFFFMYMRSSARVGHSHLRDSAHFIRFGPSQRFLRPATAELVSVGPRPPSPARGWAGPHQAISSPISFAARFTAISFLMLCAVATRPNSTLTFLLDFRRKRLKP